MKELRRRQLRTVFGTVDVRCHRYCRCTCRGGKRWHFGLSALWGLKRNTPEFAFPLAKRGSKVPYRRAAELLGEFLPISDTRVSYTTVRHRRLAVGAHLDQLITESDEYDWPESQRQPVPTWHRLTVAIDGSYVRSNLDMGLYQHYVVSGRVGRDGTLGSRFAWIHSSEFAGQWFRQLPGRPYATSSW